MSMAHETYICETGLIGACGGSKASKPFSSVDGDVERLLHDCDLPLSMRLAAGQ